MRKFLLIFLICASLLLYAKPSLAAKKRTRVSGSENITPVPSNLPKGVVSLVTLRSDRKALIVTLSNFSNIDRVDYRLKFTGNGLPQAVMGTIMPTSETVERELLFATCSRADCSYYTGIKDMKLEIISNMKTGVYRKVIKPYKIKV